MTINHHFPLRDTDLSNTKGHSDFPRHRWYYYKEGFSPELVAFAVNESNVKGNDFILDPFNGSGTVTLTASELGYKSIGIEVNPFALFLSKVKQVNVSSRTVEQEISEVIRSIRKPRFKSPLLNFSTFSDSGYNDKWLFNPEVLNAYYSAFRTCQQVKKPATREVLKLALLSAIMKNCNAVRDGKCFRYRSNWESFSFDRKTLLEDFENTMSLIISDLNKDKITQTSSLIGGDSRRKLSEKKIGKFKLCLTSPPYLNSFDYTDVYRPELFLGEFIKSQEGLLNLRGKTIQSHASAKLSGLQNINLGSVFDACFSALPQSSSSPWQRKIPIMVKAYFEDMRNILSSLAKHAAKEAQLWVVVSNSAYNGYEIPVDLILADIGSRVGWNLSEIGVLRNIHKRGSKYSPDIIALRESVVIFGK